MFSSNETLNTGFNNLLYLSPIKNNINIKEKDSETCSNSKSSNSKKSISPFNSANSKYENFISSELMNHINEISPNQIKIPFQNNLLSIENETNYLLKCYEDKNKKEKKFENFYSKNFVKKLNFNECLNCSLNEINCSLNPNINNIYKGFEELCQDEDKKKIFSKKGSKVDKLKKKKNIQKNYIERSGDWECFKCKNMNFSYRKFCNLCNFSKKKSIILFEEKKKKMFQIFN